MSCGISLVYLDMTNQTHHRSTVCAKGMDAECTVLFGQHGDYYYIYADLFKFAVQWSAKMFMGPLTGYVGHHLTIGHTGARWNVHHTLYETDITPQGHVLNVQGTKRLSYTVKNNRLIKTDKSTSGFMADSAIAIWNRLTCFAAGQLESITRQHGGALSLSVSASKASTSASVLNASEIVAETVRRCGELNGRQGVVRMPFVPKAKEALVTRGLLRALDDDVSYYMVVSCPALNCSFLAKNMFAGV